MKNDLIYLSRGNEKIYQSYIFNLPTRTTCLGATEMCKAVCYSKCQESLYPDCRLSRMRNLEASKRPDFPQLILAKLKNAKFRRLRIHESGDFYNQTYLDKWVEIIKTLPEFKFWAYTKSYQLDFYQAKKLSNFKLRMSGDATSLKEAWATKLPKSILSSTTIDGIFVCPASKEKGHKVRCMRDCYFCAEDNQPLIFLPHGTYKNKVKQFEQEVSNG